MAVDLTTLTNVLKYQYGPRLLDFLAKKHIYLSKIQKKVLPIQGKQFVFPARVGENEGLSAGAETADLPTAGKTAYLQPAFYPKQQRGRVTVYVKSMDATKSKEGSWIRAWDEQIKSTLRNMRRWIDAMLLGDGTGRLAYLSGADDNTVLTTLLGYQGPSGDHLVQNNMVVDVIDLTDYTTAIASARTVSARTKTGCTISGAALAGTAAGDYFIRAGSNGYNVHGLHGIVSQTDPPKEDYGGLDRDDTANEEWKGQQCDLTTISVIKIDGAYDQIAEIADEPPDLMMCRHSTLRKIASLLVPTQVHYVMPNLKGNMELTWKGLEYRGTAIVPDPHIWSQELYMIRLADFMIGQLRPLGWMDDDGAIMCRLSNKAGYEATLLWDIEHICEFPKRQMRGYNAET
ncbi:MAG TPA: phage major capsid protein [Phycisphaerae bacterium]|nr:phage major capsid protein [Phycisphaerae bacterium]